MGGALVATSSLRVGLTPAAELRVIVEPWRHVDGITSFGDLTLRARLK